MNNSEKRREKWRLLTILNIFKVSGKVRSIFRIFKGENGVTLVSNKGFSSVFCLKSGPFVNDKNDVNTRWSYLIDDL